MPSTKVNLSVIPILCLALLGSAVSDRNSDTVRVNLQTENFDGNVAVPRWVLNQAAASSFGIVSNNNWSYDDETLPASVKIDSDCYEIRVDLNSFDQDRARVKTLDSQTIQVEARQRYVNRYGTSTSRTVNRRFTVPRSYDVYRSDARITNQGIMVVSVPNVNGNRRNIDRDTERIVRVSY